MRVRILKAVRGPDTTLDPGYVGDFDAEYASALIKSGAGIAESPEPVTVQEAAVLPETETAAKPAPKRRGRKPKTPPAE